MHIDLVNFLLNQLQLLIQARFLGLQSVSIPLSLIDLFRNLRLDLLEQIRLLLHKLLLLALDRVGLFLCRLLLRFDLVLNVGVSLLVGLQSIEFLHELLCLDMHLQLDNLFLQGCVLDILVLDLLLLASLRLFELLLLCNQGLHQLKNALFIQMLFPLRLDLHPHIFQLLGLFGSKTSGWLRCLSWLLSVRGGSLLGLGKLRAFFCLIF